jgi:hypothetical protein
MDETWRTIYEALSATRDYYIPYDSTYSAAASNLSGFYEPYTIGYWGTYHSPRPIKVKPRTLNEIKWD